ncbi:YveK family protein [Sporolactobacillus putidus]|uniref:Capsular polysaccharide biosynthesis protein n=1 Tax=Sporolactobacillus putidus TaxID=492735 RepID=A0A917S5K0_9BACL|nr:Wzz/FepE/Etk N-terminal domain-containing protein [Sporolactobacillus putidus]GGL56328.1 capsular polysaccharide biosynthesis protein [Sporolactobacillus putidus]
MKEAISLKDIFHMLKKQLLMIITVTLLAGAAGALVTHYLMKPKYDASTRILVNQSNANQSTLYDTNALQTNVQLVNTYSVIIDDPTVLNQVIRNLNLNMTAGQLQGMLTVNTVQNSQIFSLTAETGSPELSVRIVNGVADVFKTQVQKVMKVDNVNVLSPAELAASSTPVKPRLMMNIAISIVIGLIASVGLAFLLDYLDNTIKTEEDVERKLGFPVIGAVSHIGRYREIKPESFAAAANCERLIGGEHVEAK